MTDAENDERRAMIDYEIASCTECGSREFPKHSDCQACTDFVDDFIAMYQKAKGDGAMAETRDVVREEAK
jgi:hypothetical protein